MSEAEGAKPKPIVVVVFTKGQENEKWHWRKFRVPDQVQRLQSYGQTSKEAHDRMLQMLDRMIGKLNYTTQEG